MNIVINVCFGGFSLSDKAMEMYLAAKGIEWEKQAPKYENWGSTYWRKGCVGSLDFNNYLSSRDPDRDDPDLVKVVETLGRDADGFCAQLKVVEIPDDIEWELCEYDGNESVAEKHRVWK